MIWRVDPVFREGVTSVVLRCWRCARSVTLLRGDLPEGITPGDLGRRARCKACGAA